MIFWLDNWCANESLSIMLNIIDTPLIDTSLMVWHFLTYAKECDVIKIKLLVDDVHMQLILATPIPSHFVHDDVYKRAQMTKLIILWFL